MPLHIGNVSAEMDISTPATTGSDIGQATLPFDSTLYERLKPMVVRIIQEELENYRHRQG